MHVSNYFRDTHSHFGGAEQACYRTIRMTLDHGHDACAGTGRFDADRAKLTNSLRLYPLPRTEDYLPQAVVKYSEAAKWYSLQYDPFSRAAFKKVLKKERPDLVHFHNFQFLTFSLLREAFSQGVPACLSIYDYWVFCPKAMLLLPDNTFCREAHGVRCLRCLPAGFGFIQRMLLAVRKRVFDTCFEMIDVFIVLSEHSALVLKNYGIKESKIKVIPLTLPLEYQDGGTEASIPRLPDNSILFAGWLNDRKGVHIAIEAMRHILKEVPDAKLYIIGGRAKFAEEYERKYNGIIKRNDLHEHLVFLGQQPPEIVRGYLKRSSVLVIPEQYENMSPLIMVEAMALGKPVVASNLGGIPEYIRHGETGFLAHAYNPESFAVHIIRILKDPEAVSSVGKAAKEFIMRNNSDERIWEKTISVYKGLIAANRDIIKSHGQEKTKTLSATDL